MKTLKNTIRNLIPAVALVLPTAASAAPIVWFHVPDGEVEDIPGTHDDIRDAENSVADHAYAVERREEQVDMARKDRRISRKARRITRGDRREARKDVRKALKGDGDLADATLGLTVAERTFEEAKDRVALEKERVKAARLHVDLEEARLSRSKARLEWEQAALRADTGHQGFLDFKPIRFAKQFNRIQGDVRDARTDWDVARVDVRERTQDWLASTTPGEGWIVSVIDFGDAIEKAGQGHVALRRVFFDLGSSELDTQDLNDLAWDAHVLRDNRDVTVRIEGHTDATGPMRLNRELAWERAFAVRDFLASQGVWTSQLEVAGYGETMPIVHTDGPMELNRRAELRVIEDPDGLVDGTLEDEADPFDF